jgi:hypothetical protein
MAAIAGYMQLWKAGFLSFVAWLKGNLMAEPRGPMQLWKTVLLFFYLVIAGFLTLYCVYGLWAAEPQAAQWRPAAEPTYTDEEKPAAGTPKIKFIDPQMLITGIGQASIRVFGYNFDTNSQVRFNGIDFPTQYVSEHQLVVPLRSFDLDVPGAVVVRVVNGDRSSDAVTLMVEPARSISGEWKVFGWRTKVHQELWLILLVFLIGAFGASVAGLASLADYLGERQLLESWFTFYLARPFIGGGLAFIFYLVLRGGFLIGTDYGTPAVNPFGLAAVAALVGMFSSRASLKLKEIADSVFKTDPVHQRPDQLGQLTITTRRKLPDARAGVPYAQRLEASGGTSPYTWASLTQLPEGLTLNVAGELSGNPAIATPAARYTVQVTDSTGTSATAELELTVAG